MQSNSNSDNNNGNSNNNATMKNFQQQILKSSAFKRAKKENKQNSTVNSKC